MHRRQQYGNQNRKYSNTDYQLKNCKSLPFMPLHRTTPVENPRATSLNSSSGQTLDSFVKNLALYKEQKGAFQFSMGGIPPERNIAWCRNGVD